MLALPIGTAKAEFTLSDFNGTGFDWTFDSNTFQQTIGPASVRLTDNTTGWGGAGIVAPGGGLDLSPYGSERLVIDMVVEAGNGVSQFDIELIDQVGSGGSTQRSGKWTFNVSGLTPGVPSRLFSTTTLDNPPSGIGDYQNLDLTDIDRWQVLGQYGSSQPFDISFDRIAVSGETPPAYPGQELDAEWRTQAATQIDAIRKADATVKVVDLAGNPVPGANVTIHQQQHEFGFGSAVQAYRLRDNAPQYDQYKDKVAELFNVATLENNLKWQPWEGEWGGQWTQQGALNALDWLASQGIAGRGHVMVWPGYNNLPSDIKAMLDSGNTLTPTEQNEVRIRIAEHIAEVGAATNGKVVAWDVINETRTNNDLMNQLSEGNQAMVTWLQQAEAATDATDLYINDYGILSSGGGTNTSNQNQYYNTIEYLLDQGAPLDGIGFQGHYRAGELTGPEQLWEILDRFNELGLEMQVTEFDFETTDEQLQADYTRDFLTAMFAHSGVSDVIHWGFWEGAHWRPDAALYRSDWSIKPNGQAYLDLVFGEWWTETDGVTDGLGEAIARVFKGEYLVTASLGGTDYSLHAEFLTDGDEVTITVPILVGDYNDDGTVNLADYTLWRNTLGSDTELSADGDGSGKVDAADYMLWKQNFGSSLPSTYYSTAIPEPTTCSLVVAASTVGLLCRRQRVGR
ncbi:endo-1,4-beta-xylanase [Aeoliella sp.]|uniref:endo-1,4-beta-xylanase n=1 Tax=Aeoliella sp. TaxID=2795800 RepID=UPI003CCC2B05